MSPSHPPWPSISCANLHLTSTQYPPQPSSPQGRLLLLIIGRISKPVDVIGKDAGSSPPSAFTDLSVAAGGSQGRSQRRRAEEMAIHGLAVVLVKRSILHLLFRLSPLLWPFNLYLPQVRQLPGMCLTVRAASALLFFRLRRIIAARVPRYRRAIHLVWDELRIDQAVRHRRPSVLDDNSISSLLAVAI